MVVAVVLVIGNEWAWIWRRLRTRAAASNRPAVRTKAATKAKSGANLTKRPEEGRDPGVAPH